MRPLARKLDQTAVVLEHCHDPDGCIANPGLHEIPGNVLGVGSGVVPIRIGRREDKDDGIPEFSVLADLLEELDAVQFRQIQVQ